MITLAELIATLWPIGIRLAEQSALRTQQVQPFRFLQAVVVNATIPFASRLVASYQAGQPHLKIRE